MSFRISAALAIGLATAFDPHHCRAASSNPSPATPSPPTAELISLTVAADAEQGQRLESVAEELLARLSVSVRFRRVERIDLEEIARPSASPSRPSVRYLARAYIDLRTSNVATLYLVDPAHDRVLVRRVEREMGEGGAEVTREQLGHILETSTEGLLAGMKIGRPRQEVAPTLVGPASASSRAARVAAEAPRTARATQANSLHASLLYEGEVMSGSAPITHGPALGLLGHHAIHRMAIGLWLLAQYRWTYDLDAQPVGARVGGGALRLLATLDVRQQAPLSFRFALGGGLDRVNLKPTSAESQDAPVTLAPSRSLTFAVFRAQVAGRLRLARRAHLIASALLDFDPSRTRYVFNAGSGQQVVMQPWAVRPGFSLGFEVP